jgi:hypothetical protein
MIYLKRLFHFLFTRYRPVRSRTVRVAFPLGFFALTVAAAAALTATDASYVRLTTNTDVVVAGEPFSITVAAGAHRPVNAVDITLEFPADVIEISGIDTGNSVITLWTEPPAVTGETITLRGGTFRRGFVGENEIATINAVARYTGVATFSAPEVTLLAGDGRGTTVPVAEREGASVVIQAESDSEGQLTSRLTMVVTTDVNGDGTVDMSDVLAFIGDWTLGNRRYDFNDDQRMTFTDFGIILSDYFYQ